MSAPQAKPRPVWPAVVTAGVVGGAVALLLAKVIPMALASLQKLRDDVVALAGPVKAALDAKDAKIADLEAKLADAGDTSDDDAVVAEAEKAVDDVKALVAPAAPPTADAPVDAPVEPAA